MENDRHETAGRRLRSLDAFRGLTILGMLLVNNAALDTATPEQLTHAEWNQGVHFADLVFPWFLLIVGVALPFSLGARREKGASAAQRYAKVLTRSMALVLLGWLVDSSVARRPVIGLGVLQLIGLTYLMGAMLYALPAVWRWGAAFALLAGHWAALRFIPVPGQGAGLTEQVNLAAYLNEAYLRPLHLAGLVSVVPTAALVLIGAGIGEMMRGPMEGKRKLAFLCAAGLALTAAGWVWSLDLPFSKSLWTAPYIVFTGGLGTLTFAALFVVSDLYPISFVSFPLAVVGANAIFAYVVPILVKMFVLQGWSWGRVTLQHAFLDSLRQRFGMVGGGWVYTGAYLFAWWLVLLYLYRRRIFLRV